MSEQEIRQRVVDKVLSQLGVTKGSAGHRAIVDTYNSHTPLPTRNGRPYRLTYTDDWCAATVSAVAIACGLTDIMPVECSCGEMMRLYQAMGRWVEDDNYAPQPGDVMFYAWADNGVGDCKLAPNHVGIVTRVLGDAITVTEGNMGKDSVVGSRRRARGGRYIRGYAIPDYASKAQMAPVPSLGTTATTEDKPWYAEAQEWAVSMGIVRGTDNGLAPEAVCTRAEVWQMLKNYDRASQEAQRGE